MDEQMSNEQRRAFLSYLDEKDKVREGYVTIVEMDHLLIKFKTNNGNLITIK